MPSIISAGTTTGTALSLTSDTSGELQIRTNNGSTTAMTLTTAGNVGIGTTSPDSRLHVVSGSVAALRIGFGGASENYLDGDLNIFRNAIGSEAMRITSTGLVGIGLSSPSSVLDIAANNSGMTITNTGASNKKWRVGGGSGGIFQITEAGVADRLTIDTSGNCGIGTASPSTRLHVSGSGPTVRIDGTAFGNSGAKLQLLGWAAAEPNWQIDTASIANGLEFVPSTAAGGSTFTTPAFSMLSSGIFTVASGVQFPATQVASANANTLDDYEEGTWTPNLGGNTTYISQFGFYRKVGSLVFINAYLKIDVLGTGSASIVRGLPFNPTQSSSQHECVFTVSKADGLSIAVTSISLRNNGTDIYATYRTASSVTGVTNGAYIASGTELNFSGCYIIF